MTRPARSETRISGTVFRKVPLNSRAVNVLNATITTSSTGAHQIGSMTPRRGALFIPSPRQVEVAGLPVHRQRDGQQNENPRGNRGAHRASDRLADTGRTAGRG